MMYVSSCQLFCGLIDIFIIGFKFFTWSEGFNSLLYPICLFLGPHLVRSSVKGLSILHTPTMLYYNVTGFNSFALVECKANMLNSLVMSWNLYISVHTNMSCRKQTIRWHLSSTCLVHIWVTKVCQLPCVLQDCWISLQVTKYHPSCQKYDISQKKRLIPRNQSIILEWTLLILAGEHIADSEEWYVRSS